LKGMGEKKRVLVGEGTETNKKGKRKGGYCMRQVVISSSRTDGIQKRRGKEKLSK